MYTITRETRCGNDEASYYVTERAVLKRLNGEFAWHIYVDDIDDGLYSTDNGVWITGVDPNSWHTVDEPSPEAQKIVDSWIESGWVHE